MSGNSKSTGDVNEPAKLVLEPEYHNLTSQYAIYIACSKHPDLRKFEIAITDNISQRAKEYISCACGLRVEWWKNIVNATRVERSIIEILKTGYVNQQESTHPFLKSIKGYKTISCSTCTLAVASGPDSGEYNEVARLPAIHRDVFETISELDNLDWLTELIELVAEIDFAGFDKINSSKGKGLLGGNSPPRFLYMVSLGISVLLYWLLKSTVHW